MEDLRSLGLLVFSKFCVEMDFSLKTVNKDLKILPVVGNLSPVNSILYET